MRGVTAIGALAALSVALTTLMPAAVHAHSDSLPLRMNAELDATGTRGYLLKRVYSSSAKQDLAGSLNSDFGFEPAGTIDFRRSG